MSDILLSHQLKGGDATHEFGKQMGKIIPGERLLALRGDLGAGKTTFTQGLARGLDVPAHIPIQSPTYNLVHSHRGRLTLHHLDFYRLAHPDELRELGFEELQQPQSVTVVEWADRFLDEIPSTALWIELQYVDEHSRKLTLRGEAAQWQTLIDTLDLP